MSSDDVNSAVWPRSCKWSFLLLLAGMFVSLIWTIHPYYDASNDAAVYVVTTRSLLAGEGYSYLGTPVILRPPGFSCLLSPVMALLGTNFTALNTTTSLFGILGVAMIFVLFRSRFGALLSFCACATIWLNPFYQRFCAKVMSDVPGAALLIVCLVLERWARRSPSSRRYALLGLAIAAAMYVRTTNGLLIPAIALAQLVEFIRSKDDDRVKAALRGVIWVVVLPLLAYTPLVLRNMHSQIPVPNDQFSVHSYTTAMFHTAPDDPNSPLITFTELKDRATSQLDRILPLLGKRMREDDLGTAHYVFACFGILCWLFIFLREMGPGEFLCGMLLVTLTIYFEFEPRLALPFYLLVFLMTLQSLHWVATRVLGQKAGRVFLSVAVLLLCIADFDPWSWQEVVAKRHQANLELKDYIDSRFPVDAPMAAPNGRHYGVFLERPVYTLNTAARTRGFKGVTELIRKHRVTAIVADSFDPLERKHIAPLRHTYRLEKRIGSFLVFLGPGTASRRARN